MGEYIERQEVEKFIDECLLREDKLQRVEKETLLAVKRHIDSIQPADVWPAFQGEWLRTKQKAVYQLPNFYYVYKCSRCAYNTHTDLTNFCPNCGAALKGVSNAGN